MKIFCIMIALAAPHCMCSTNNPWKDCFKENTDQTLRNIRKQFSDPRVADCVQQGGAVCFLGVGCSPGQTQQTFQNLVGNGSCTLAEKDRFTNQGRLLVCGGKCLQALTRWVLKQLATCGIDAEGVDLFRCVLEHGLSCVPCNRDASCRAALRANDTIKCRLARDKLQEGHCEVEVAMYKSNPEKLLAQMKLRTAQDEVKFFCEDTSDCNVAKEDYTYMSLRNPCVQNRCEQENSLELLSEGQTSTFSAIFVAALGFVCAALASLVAGALSMRCCKRIRSSVQPVLHE
eukprot:TRINITY_DN20_c0_g1_i2.p1 TRINITY_DN20_c0_g1~~TRINITY_DN20_c0_g1_i2.p1  ORF type:complete len:288 (-),score=30.27 TRINITY_DN20_c0_g1_i2:255-1118(-)